MYKIYLVEFISDRGDWKPLDEVFLTKKDAKAYMAIQVSTTIAFRGNKNLRKSFRISEYERKEA
jgi:hypothetical protein